jgi:DNA-binding NtrC family response regulator
MDGIALAQEVTKRWGHISILIISGHAAPTDPRMPPSAGFVQKPFALDALVRVLM